MNVLSHGLLTHVFLSRVGFLHEVISHVVACMNFYDVCVIFVETLWHL